MPIKTLHLTNSWHETSGGIATFYRALIAEANRQGREIRLVVPGAVDRVEEIGSCARIYHVQSPPTRLNSDYRMIYPSQFLARGSKLQEIVATERPDVIEICDKYTLNYFGALLRMKLLAGCDFRPVVVGLSCERMDDNFRAYLGDFPLSRWFCSWYMKWIYFSFFDHHIANSEYTAAELRAAAGGHIVPRSAWIRPMGVELGHLSPGLRSSQMRSRLLQNFGATNDAVLLLYVGRLVPEKNLTLLFEVMECLVRNSGRDFRLLVVGDGLERAHWEGECARKLRGRVMFAGHISDQQVLASLFANCDLFVHPNPREPFGIAPLEAMASGLAVVVPNTGGISAYANESNAWTAAANVHDFFAAITTAIGNEDMRRHKVECALNTARQYGWDRIADSFFDLYDDIYKSMEGRSTTLTPAFSSSQASPFQKFMIDGVSKSAGSIFTFLSKSLHRPRKKTAGGSSGALDRRATS